MSAAVPMRICKECGRKKRLCEFPMQGNYRKRKCGTCVSAYRVKQRPMAKPKHEVVPRDLTVSAETIELLSGTWLNRSRAVPLPAPEHPAVAHHSLTEARQ